MSKVCVILGAGASYDVRNDGSPVRNLDLQPPLAVDLFDAQNESFWDVLKEYEGARFLAQDLATRLTVGSDLESILRHYAEHPDPNIRGHFKHIPPYLRDLLLFCSRFYTHEPSGYIKLVYELLAENPHEVLFLVLNYDDLLETALSRFDSRYTFTKLADYINGDRQAKVVKLHGSINWFIPMHGPASTWNECVQNLDVLERRPDVDIRVLEKSGRTKELKGPRADWGWDIDPYLYPVLTAPLAGKGSAEIVCPGDHQAFAENFLSTCDKILAVGTSGLDDDLLDLLNRSMSVDPGRLIHLVGMGQETVELVLSRFKSGVEAFDARISEFHNGFQEYIGGSSFSSFCSGAS